MKGELKFTTRVDRGLIASEAMRQAIYDIFVDLLLDLADELQKGSYVGASKAKGRDSLQEGWDVIAPRKESVGFNIKSSVVNRTPAALYRIVGRDAGKFPPVQPIRDWVEVVLGESDPKRIKAIAFLIGKKIAERGTQRYRGRTNYAGLNADGTVKQDSIIKEYEQLIIQTLRDVGR